MADQSRPSQRKKQNRSNGWAKRDPHQHEDLRSALRPSSKADVDDAFRPRLLTSDERDDFECNPNYDWYAGDDCFDEDTLLTKMNWYQWIPVLNIVADCVNSVPMIPDRLEQLLTMAATVYSLLLGVVLSIPLSVSWDELEASAARFAPNGSYYDPDLTAFKSSDPAFYRDVGTYLVNELARCVSNSLGLLMACLLTTLFLYIVLTSTSFRDPWRERNSNMLKDWWIWMRLSIFALYILTAVAITYLGYAVKYLFVLKFPSPKCQDLAAEGKLDECIDFPMSFGATRFNRDSPWTYYADFVVLLGLPLMILMGWIVPSIALTHKTWSYTRLQQERVQAHVKSQKNDDAGMMPVMHADDGRQQGLGHDSSMDLRPESWATCRELA